MLAQLERGAGRAGKGDHVLAGQVLEKIPHSAAHQLHGACGQQARCQDAAEHALGEIAGLGGRFHDRRHPGQQCGRQLLQHPPYREVEGIDVHGRPFQGCADVLADKAAALGQPLEGAVDVDAAVGQLARALARVHEQGADAAVDVHPGIGLGGTGGVGELVELLLVLAEELGESLEQGGALVEGERAQRRTPDAARMLQHGLRIGPEGMGAGDHRTGGGIAQHGGIARAAAPPSCHEALELHSHSTTCPSMRCERPRNRAMRAPSWLKTVIS